MHFFDFSPGGGEFDHKNFKSSNARGVAGGCLNFDLIDALYEHRVAYETFCHIQ